MRLILLTMLSAAMMWSCAPKQQEQAAETGPAANTLTEEEKTAGWVLLFDGQTMNGWRSYKGAEQDCWEVQDGALHCKGSMDADKRADILTTDQYENYEFAFDWKISPGGNSGVIYRCSEEFDAPYYSGPEYQVIDDAGYNGDLTELQKAAANYDMHAAEPKAANPVGEWNQSKIIVNGAHCEHWLNGQKVVEYEFGSEDWTKRKEISKWKDAAGYGMTTKGHIDLQDHGHDVWYRNLKIRVL
ncbi:MAG: DUF1080 domain-containing protein [Bacteroidota bacterium]